MSRKKYKQRVFKGEDGVYGVILTQFEIDLLLSLLGPTPSHIGTPLYRTLKKHSDHPYAAMPPVAIPHEELAAYIEKLKELGFNHNDD